MLQLLRRGGAQQGALVEPFITTQSQTLHTVVAVEDILHNSNKNKK